MVNMSSAKLSRVGAELINFVSGAKLMLNTLRCQIHLGAELFTSILGVDECLMKSSFKMVSLVRCQVM